MKAEDFAHLYALEENYWWFVGMRDITAALLDSIEMPTGDLLVLDAGCGTGVNLTWLKRYARRGNVVGIDLIADALTFCRERTHQRLAQASVTNLPFADSAFDFVTSFDVLVQLPGVGADTQAIKEMRRVLRRGGVAFVRVAAYEWMRSGHDAALGTRRRYQLEELTRLLQENGFDVLRATYANSIPLPLAIMQRLVFKRLRIVNRGSDVKPLSPKLQWLNTWLTRALRFEARMLRDKEKSLPFGLSAICVARKID